MHHRPGAARRIRLTFSTAALLAALPWIAPAMIAQPSEPAAEFVEPDFVLVQGDIDVHSLDIPSESIDEPIEASSLPPEVVELLLDQIERHPETRDDLVEQFPELARHLNNAEAAEDEAETEPPAADPEALIAAEKKRQQAEALIAGLAEADADRVRQIEVGLAELGEASLVPLKLAALSDDFELRTQAGAMARRLRWRLVAHDTLLNERPDLPAVLAAEDQQPRRKMIDAVLADPQPHLVPLLVECLADRDVYLRERGIDGLVKIGGAFDSTTAAKALERAALTADDESVVLLAVAGLGEIGQVDIDVLTELFESTESGEVQRTVLHTAGYSRQADAIDLVERALKDPRWRVRAAGLEALEDVARSADKARIGKMVQPLLADPEPFIRATALRLMSDLELPGAEAQLWKMFQAGEIDEDAGLEALANLGSTRAYTLLVERYNQASDPNAEQGAGQDAMKWLGLLTNYRNQTEVDLLIVRLLKDETRRDQWQQAVYFAARRNNYERFLPTISAMLLDKDAAVRQAVWSAFGQYRMRDYTLPDAVDEGLAAGDTEQRLWRINLIYQRGDSDPTGALSAALNDDDPSVVATALAMIGELKLSDALGETNLPYRSGSRDYTFDDFGNPIPATLPQGGFPETLSAPLKPLLDHDNPLVAVRAATLLYASETDRAEKVVAVLQGAIRSDDPMRQAVALKAAAAEPGKLTEGVDLLSLVRDQDNFYLLKNASAVMLATGKPELVAEVIRLSADIDIDRDEAYFVTLAATGSAEAIELVYTKLAAEYGYTRRSFLQQLVAANPEAAVDLGVRLIALKDDNDQYDRQQMLGYLMPTKSPKLIPVLEAEIQRLSSSRDHWERQNATRYEQMLLELDPERAKKQIGEALASGEPAEQQRAIQTLMGMTPSDEVAELVLTAVFERQGEVDPSWAGLVPWLKSTAAYPRLQAAISDLPAPMQTAMIGDLATKADPQGVATLLSIKPADADTRDRITMILAELTTKFPDTRPASFEALDPLARVYLLSAAGQWPGGEKIVRAWLDDEDSETANAALRGLAIARLLDLETPLEEADASRFAEAVTASDPGTAYLAAEVLVQFDRDRLLAIDPESIRAQLALLRIATLQYERDGGPIDQAVDAALRNQGELYGTAMRFALIATINANQRRMYRIGAPAVQSFHTDLAPRAALQFGQYQEFVQAQYVNPFKPGDPGTEPLVKATLDRLVGRGDYNVGLLIDHGFVERIPTDKLKFYLDAYARWQADQWDTPDWDAFATLLDTEDPELPGVLKEIVEDQRVGSLYAAMLAWHLYEDAASFERVFNTMLQAGEDTRRQLGGQARQQAAMLFIQHEGRPEHVPRLLETHANRAESDDWQARNAAQQLLNLAVLLDPNTTRDYLRARLAEQANDDEGFDTDHTGNFSIADLLNAMVIDDADFADKRLTHEEMQLTDALLAVKQGNDGSRFSTLPWDEGANLYINPDAPAMAEQERRLVFKWIEQGKLDENERDTYVSDLYESPAVRMDEARPMLDHESRVGGVFGWYQQAGVMFNDPDQIASAAFYNAMGTLITTVPLDPGFPEAAEQLGPMIASEDAGTASRAIRAAATWRATPLKQQLINAIARPDEVGVEAAWASALLFGQASLEAVRTRMQSADDFDERIELACLLVLLGDSALAEPVLAEGRALLTVQQLRGRGLAYQPPVAIRSNNHRGFDDFDYQIAGHWAGGGGASPIDGALPDSNHRWAALLKAVDARATPDSLTHRLEFAPQSKHTQNGVWPSLTSTLQRDDQLALGRSDFDTLAFHGSQTNDLPIPDMLGYNAPAFAHLEQHESLLFNRSLTQLSSTATSRVTLASAWEKWIEAHGSDDPDTLWRDGVASAIEALTDARWWRRVVALERLQRLTGQAIDAPALFDSDQWAALQDRWRSWSQTPEGSSARSALGAAAVKAELIDTAPTNADAELAALIRMAGWGSEVLSRAALHRLELWPDRAALIKAAAPWQAAPRPTLRHWYLSNATDKPRIYLDPEALE